jgi:hypothetical protein
LGAEFWGGIVDACESGGADEFLLPQGQKLQFKLQTFVISI